MCALEIEDDTAADLYRVKTDRIDNAADREVAGKTELGTNADRVVTSGEAAREVNFTVAAAGEKSCPVIHEEADIHRAARADIDQVGS